MEGLDRKAALEHIVPRLATRFPGRWPSQQLGELVAEICEADHAYMRENDVLDAQGKGGEGYYDDDDAFEFIMEALTDSRGLDEDNEMPYAELVDAYMEEWEAYLEAHGFITWD